MIPINLSSLTANGSSPLYDPAYPLGDRGALSSGTFTITGTGFGIKTSDVYFDNFESYSTGAISVPTGVGRLSVWNAGSSIVNSSSHSGTKSWRHDMAINEFPQVHINYAAPAQRAYFSCRFKFTGSGSGAPVGVWKFGRFGNDYLYQPNRYSDEYTSVSTATQPTDFSGSLAVKDNAHGSASQYIHNSGTNTATAGAELYTPDVWHFYEMEVESGSSVAGNDGLFIVRVDGVESVKFVGLSIRTDTFQSLIQWVLTPITGYSADSTTVVEWMDEVYTSADRARVVMTDSATYASSTNWAIQNDATWSNASITGARNNGSFASGSTAYDHVFNSSGTLVHTTAGFIV